MARTLSDIGLFPLNECKDYEEYFDSENWLIKDIQEWILVNKTSPICSLLNYSGHWKEGQNRLCGRPAFQVMPHELYPEWFAHHRCYKHRMSKEQELACRYRLHGDLPQSRPASDYPIRTIYTQSWPSWREIVSLTPKQRISSYQRKQIHRRQNKKKHTRKHRK